MRRSCSRVKVGAAAGSAPTTPTCDKRSAHGRVITPARVRTLTPSCDTALCPSRPSYDLATKSWELDLEIAGIVTPSDAHVLLFAQTAAAR
jgi:hypothetical protein